jgi:hypothetical protein
MSGAYAPISAIVMSEEFYARLAKGSDEKGWFAHAGTYHAHPVAAAVALKVLDIFETRDILGHVRSILPAWQRHLQSLEDHPIVSTTRHFGLAAGIELEQGQQRAVQGSLSSGTWPQVYEAGLAEGVIRATARSLPRHGTAADHNRGGDRRAFRHGCAGRSIAPPPAKQRMIEDDISTLGQQVYRRLYDRLMSGAFAARGQADVARVGRELGTSMQPIREAVRDWRPKVLSSLRPIA